MSDNCKPGTWRNPEQLLLLMGGAMMALLSLGLARLIPHDPQPGMETTPGEAPLSDNT